MKEHSNVFIKEDIQIHNYLNHRGSCVCPTAPYLKILDGTPSTYGVSFERK